MYLLVCDDFDKKAFLAHSDFDVFREESWFKDFASGVMIGVDGRWIVRGTVEIKNGRSMMPIASVARAIGAKVDWDAETRTVTIKRAATEITLVIGEDFATVNGEKTALDVAPYLSGMGYTMLPVRFVAEQLSQSVAWNAKNQVINITEDMSFEGDSNLKAWILGCSTVLTKRNRQDPYVIGGGPRTGQKTEKERGKLSNSWSIDSREDLLDTILRMTDYGHAASFAAEAEFIMSMSDAEYREFLSGAAGMDAYMWPLVKSLGEKWGDRGIKAWDWFRMMHIASWGYVAGYLEMSELYAVAETVAERLRAAFSSWDEATDNYMDGYAYWSRTDLSEPDTEYETRLQIYADLKAAQKTGGLLFDPAVWTEAVKGAKGG
jgi:hypothetical protein